MHKLAIHCVTLYIIRMKCCVINLINKIHFITNKAFNIDSK
ncbi:hypothetical protein XIS1_620010 [Xenorhabdus innexi]|uniref:Uncharacterized protein n=1 Tax=Xenorhabdus innexi TaxID=290109 RepID=A0A1N6N032_9GAMM|nr:hypothetical protein XIS1_620010 [Xenorhabdus innexi]